MYTPLQLREVFHLEFLRQFGRKIQPDCYALKGGVNLRLFFKSFRYSEDMDLDIQTVSVEVVRDTVMKILQSVSFRDMLIPFGIERVVLPDIVKSKQTQTTQRFKIHLITHQEEDFFTKIEFSRRGFSGKVIIQPVEDSILRIYKSPPLMVPHYDLPSAVAQKIKALSMRAIIQARDVFDLYILTSQYQVSKDKSIKLEKEKIKTAYNNIFEVSFEQFRDAVLVYLSEEDKSIYSLKSVWDEIKLKVAGFIEQL